MNHTFSEALSLRIAAAIDRMEETYDPEEAERSRQARLARESAALLSA